ncbi:hypothetical protein Tco_0880711 [Tanacetum coccineum]
MDVDRGMVTKLREVHDFHRMAGRMTWINEGAISEYVSKVGGVEDKMDGNNMQIDNGVREDGEDDEESNSESSRE